MLGTTLSSFPGLRHLDKVVAGSPTVVTSLTPRLNDQQRPEQEQDDVRVYEAVRSAPTPFRRSAVLGLVTSASRGSTTPWSHRTGRHTLKQSRRARLQRISWLLSPPRTSLPLVPADPSLSTRLGISNRTVKVSAEHAGTRCPPDYRSVRPRRFDHRGQVLSKWRNPDGAEARLYAGIMCWRAAFRLVFHWRPSVCVRWMTDPGSGQMNLSSMVDAGLDLPQTRNRMVYSAPKAAASGSSTLGSSGGGR
jgi:hypothetical protein